MQTLVNLFWFVGKNMPAISRILKDNLHEYLKY